MFDKSKQDWGSITIQRTTSSGSESSESGNKQW